jgi:Fur family transcriptional regulator, ferric uptake regulator
MAKSRGTSWNEHAEAELKRAGHRTGGARTAVIEQLGAQHCCMSAQSIFDSLRAQGSTVGLASVYRALELLSATKLVHRIDIDSVAHYEPADPGGEHHHHVVCDRCGDVSAFEDPSLERAIDRLAGKIKHEVSGHDVVLHGTCPACS